MIVKFCLCSTLAEIIDSPLRRCKTPRSIDSYVRVTLRVPASPRVWSVFLHYLSDFSKPDTWLPESSSDLSALEVSAILVKMISEMGFDE